MKCFSGFQSGGLLNHLNSPHILIVEDEKNLGSTLTERLEAENYRVTWATTQAEALACIVNQRFDLALLDIGLPDGSGFEVAQAMKNKHPEVALIFLTAFGTPEDRIRGLEIGAEDYVVKPFHLKELILRVRNGLRRAQYLTGNLDSFGNAVHIGKAKIYFQRFEAEVDGKVYALTHKEAALLKLLIEKRGTVVSRDEILNHAWSADEYPTPRTIDNFIMRLRRLVEVHPDQPEVIKSVRGIGYLIHE